MKRILLGLGFWLWFLAPASAQAPCVGVGGVNTVPQTGVICVQDSQVPSYFVASIGIVPPATPTDSFCLTGSATRTIRVKKILIGGTANTPINITANLTKHTVVNTGGTAAATSATGLPAITAMDSNTTIMPAATATATAYTANPTVDATAAIVASQTVFLPGIGTAVAGLPAVWQFDDGGPAVSPPVLRGVVQQLCVNWNGVAAPSAGVVWVNMIFTEQTQ